MFNVRRSVRSMFGRTHIRPVKNGLEASPVLTSVFKNHDHGDGTGFQTDRTEVCVDNDILPLDYCP